MPAKTVLDVGQCNADHASICGLLSRIGETRVLRAHLPEGALEIARSQKCDLILVNRLLDQNGSPGLRIIESLKRDPQTAGIPVMLVSNFADAQNAAVAAGAAEGFGKNQLNDLSTELRLRTVLHAG